MTKLILNEDTYACVMRELVPAARRFLWLVTADLKDLYVEDPEGIRGSEFVPFVSVIAGKVRDGVEVRLVHAKEPGPRFREDFDRNEELIQSDAFERVLCPRMHMKCVIADGKLAYVGSANLTGAGMGAKGAKRRNFEAGMFTDDPEIIGPLMDYLDSFWIGDFCQTCALREVCPDPIA